MTAHWTGVVLATALALCSTHAAHAADAGPFDGPYISVGGGYASSPTDPDITLKGYFGSEEIGFDQVLGTSSIIVGVWEESRNGMHGHSSSVSCGACADPITTDVYARESASGAIGARLGAGFGGIIFPYVRVGYTFGGGITGRVVETDPANPPPIVSVSKYPQDRVLIGEGFWFGGGSVKAAIDFQRLSKENVLSVSLVVL